MKHFYSKLKLFLVALFALVGMGAWATTATTKYVLGEALAPSQLFADGKYYINNVGTGKYLAAGGSWGTHAVVNADGLDYTITYADGKYTLDSQVSNGGNNHYLNGEWNDGAAMGWIFNEVSEGVYTISNGTNFLTAGENGVVTLTADATVDAAKWTLKTLADRIAELAAATAETPVDATFLIQDANFGRNDLRKSAWTMVASNQNLSGGEDNNGSVGNNCAESYHSTFTLSQTLANAPAGKYKMTAQGFYRQDDGATEDLPVFYANDKTANFLAKTGSEGSMTDASKSFSAGQYTIEPIEVTVFENGQLTVGAKGTAVHQWVIFDNFRLSYLGSEIPAEEFAPAYDTALSNAKKALDDETYAAVTGEERTALQSAVETYSTVEETVDAYKAAIAGLTSATNTFTGAKAAYDELADLKMVNYASADRYPYASAEKKTAAATAQAAEATSAADAKVKVEALYAACRQLADSHALAEGVEGATNETDKIVNPNAEEAIAEPWAVVLGEGSGGELKVLDGEPLTDGGGKNYKYFDGGDWGNSAWDVSLKQNISLPAGKYMISASGRASGDVELKLFAGDEEIGFPALGASGGLFGRGWNDASLEFVVTEDGEVAIGVQGVTSNQYNWMSFTRFRLVCLEKSEAPAPTTYNVVVVEREHGTVVADPTTAEAGATVTIKVTPDEGYMVDEVHVTYGDDQTIDWESLDMETLTGTIIMPAADVNVLFTFKEIEDEPIVVPTIDATLVHTASSYCEGDANVYISKVDAEAEHVNNSKFSSAWQGAAYAEFSFETLPANAEITEAILTFTGIGESRNARNTDVMIVNVGSTLDYTAMEAGDAKVNLPATTIQSVSFPKASSQEFNIDATEQLKALVAEGQKFAIFKFTNNPGSGDVAGKASENAPKLVITYAPGAPEVANASFEADGEKAASNGALEMTGWTEVIDGSYNNTELRPAGSTSTTSQFGTSDPSEGDYSLFVRHGWNNGSTTVTLTSDALAEIPAGDYTLSVDYKQHYSWDNQQNENTKVTIALVNGEEILGSETSPAAAGVQGGSADATYFNDAEWSTLTASFTLDEPVAAGAKVVITLAPRGQRRSDFFLDNVQFVKVPGVEAAKLELQKVIEAAQAEKAKYIVGEDLFMYPESEMAPLTNAIATATDALNDAEATKESLNTATEALNAFVAAFAPAFNAPDADKLYTFQLRLDGENPLYMNLGEGITIAEEATALKFIATENAGQYYLANEDETLFVGLAGGNAWTMSTAAEKKAAWTFTALGEGAYRINNLVTVGRFVGTNAGEKTAGSTCYADKQTSNGNVDWLIAEYVAPVDPNDYTDRIVNADLTGEGGFDATGTKGIDGSGIVKVGSAAAFDFKQTIANLPAGKYMVTAQAAYRYGGDEAAEAAAIAGGTDTKLLQLYATVGEKTVSAKVQNRYDGASETNLAAEGAVQVNDLWVPNSSNAVKAWFEAGKYVNEVEFNLPADGAVTIGINRTGTPESDYTVIGAWTLYRLGDPEPEPEPEPEPLNPGEDATSFITNPSFETGDLTGWTVGSSSDTGVKPNSNATYTTEGCDGDYLFNTWWQGIPITQKVTGLPNGLYELKALMANDAITAGNQPCLYLLANGEHSDAFGSETAGKFAEGSLQFYVLDGTATIGAIGGNADGSFNESGYYWYKVDNFRLTYVEGLPNIDDVVIPEGKMSNAAAAAITTAKEAGDVIALLTAVEAAKASIAAYASAKSLLDDVDEVLANTNVYTAEAYETYTTAHATWTAKYEDGTLTDEEAASLRKDILPSRYIMGVDTWHWANTTDDFLLSAWTVDEVQAHEFDTKLYINMWSMEGYTDGSDFKVPFFEYWTGDGDSLGEATLKATISGLTAGETAEVDIWVRVRAKNGVAAADATGITLQVNDGEPVDVTEGDVIGDSQFSVEKYTATGVIGEDGKLFIKLKVAAENNISWLSFKDVTYSLSTIPTAITDVKGVKNVGAIYDLSGRKVEKMVKGGIYIVNGKKVSFK